LEKVERTPGAGVGLKGGATKPFPIYLKAISCRNNYKVDTMSELAERLIA
jgi:hypothetical protein